VPPIFDSLPRSENAALTSFDFFRLQTLAAIHDPLANFRGARRWKADLCLLSHTGVVIEFGFAGLVCLCA
jgi:hypothetical protein